MSVVFGSVVPRLLVDYAMCGEPSSIVGGRPDNAGVRDHTYGIRAHEPLSISTAPSQLCLARPKLKQMDWSMSTSTCLLDIDAHYRSKSPGRLPTARIVRSSGPLTSPNDLQRFTLLLFELCRLLPTLYRPRRSWDTLECLVPYYHVLYPTQSSSSPSSSSLFFPHLQNFRNGISHDFLVNLI